MAKPMQVCGVPVMVGAVLGEDRHGYDHYRHKQSIHIISKPEAERVMQRIFGPGARRPRVGTEVKLCDDQYMVNATGEFEIHRRAPGPLRGRSRRAQRRSR